MSIFVNIISTKRLDALQGFLVGFCSSLWVLIRCQKSLAPVHTSNFFTFATPWCLFSTNVRHKAVTSRYCDFCTVHWQQLLKDFHALYVYWQSKPDLSTVVVACYANVLTHHVNSHLDEKAGRRVNTCLWKLWESTQWLSDFWWGLDVREREMEKEWEMEHILSPLCSTSSSMMNSDIITLVTDHLSASDAKTDPETVKSTIKLVLGKQVIHGPLDHLLTISVKHLMWPASFMLDLWVPVTHHLFWVSILWKS